MSSGLHKYNEEQEERQAKLASAWLALKGEKIANIDPYSSEFTDFKWLEEHKEKILRNRKLIELLG